MLFNGRTEGFLGFFFSKQIEKLLKNEIARIFYFLSDFTIYL